MIGIPPTGGFFGKWHIILGAIEARDSWSYLSVAAVLIATVLTMAYFQRMFVRIYREPVPAGLEPVKTDLPFRFCVGLTSIGVIVMGLFSDPMISFFRSTAQAAGL